MGAMLPKPVLSCVVERRVGMGISVGTSELNGWRNSMEDAHLIHLDAAYQIFGVYDGHGGGQCSEWIADRLTREFKTNGCPKDDASVKDLFLRVDREFLDTGLPSGTTATMCIVHKLASGKYQLRVINSGDSRVVLGRMDGTIVDGGGTDQGLTTDHKPDNSMERARIVANGGTVELAMGGVARLNGDLAVSRGFGDAEYKKQGKDPKNLENQPATANPEMKTFECDAADFVLLVCDGVSEGDFSNSQVVGFVADALKRKEDPGAASAAVCRESVKRNSKDNVTCMCVLFNQKWCSEIAANFSKEYVPGPIYRPDDKGFMDAYKAMVKRADLTLPQALEKRYEHLTASPRPGETEDDDAKAADLDFLGEPTGGKGSEARAAYFQQLAEKNFNMSPGGGGIAGLIGALGGKA